MDEKKYADLGIGQLKVNESSGGDNAGKYHARLLCRQEGSGKITLNAAIFKSMILEHNDGKKEVGVVAVEDDKPIKYLIRTKNAAMANELFTHIKSVKDKL